MAIAVVRTVVQLVLVGFVLKYIFQVNNIFLTFAIVMVSIFNGSLGWRCCHQRLSLWVF